MSIGDNSRGLQRTILR